MKKAGKVVAILALLVIIVASLSSQAQASQILPAQSLSGKVIDQMENSIPIFQGGDEVEASDDDGVDDYENEDDEEGEDSDVEANGVGAYDSDSDDDPDGEDKGDDDDEDEDDDDDIALGGRSILGNVGIAGAVLVTLVFLSQSASGILDRAKNWLKRS